MEGAQEEERYRRHLRALSAVNWQLHAMLESGSTRSQAVAWVEQLHVSGGGEAFLVRSAARGMFCVEAGMRRAIKAGLLFAALTPVLPLRTMSDDELDSLPEGPPVEVLRGPSGPAFLVVGGRRYPLRGLPLPFAVTAEEMASFPEARELRVGAVGGSVPVRGRVRAVVAREGAMRGSVTIVRAGMRRAKRAVDPKRH
jgi:hypothetical protein